MKKDYLNRKKRSDGRSMKIIMTIRRSNNIKKAAAVVLALVVAMTFSQSVFAGGKAKINHTKKKLFVEDSVQLKIKRDGKSLNGVKWKSSNKEIATVSKSGNVVGKAPGKATITGKYNKKKYKCKITVLASACKHPKKDCCIPG